MATDIPNGTYKARATEWRLDMAKSGTDFVAVNFQLLDLPGTPAIGWRGYLTEKTIQRTVESLKACGWKGHDLGNLDGTGSNIVSIVVEAEEGQDGITRPRVRWVNDPKKAPRSAANPDQQKQIAARANKLITDIKHDLPF